MFKLIYNPYLNLLSFWWKNNEDESWHEIDKFSDLGEEKLSWSNLENIIKKGCELYGNNNESDTGDSIAWFEGTKYHCDNLPQNNIVNVENETRRMLDQNEFIEELRKSINLNSLNKTEKNKIDEICDEKFIGIDKQSFKNSLKKDSENFFQNKVIKCIDSKIGEMTLQKGYEELASSLDELEQLIQLSCDAYEKRIADNQYSIDDLDRNIRRNPLYRALIRSIALSQNKDEIIDICQRRIIDKTVSFNSKADISDQLISEYNSEINNLEKNVNSYVERIKRKILRGLKSYARNSNGVINDTHIALLKQYITEYKVLSIQEYWGIKNYNPQEDIRSIVTEDSAIEDSDMKKDEKELFDKELVKIRGLLMLDITEYIDDTMAFIVENIRLKFFKDDYKEMREKRYLIELWQYEKGKLEDIRKQIHKLRIEPYTNKKRRQPQDTLGQASTSANVQWSAVIANVSPNSYGQDFGEIKAKIEKLQEEYEKSLGNCKVIWGQGEKNRNLIGCYYDGEKKKYIAYRYESGCECSSFSFNDHAEAYKKLKQWVINRANRNPR